VGGKVVVGYRKNMYMRWECSCVVDIRPHKYIHTKFSWVGKSKTKGRVRKMKNVKGTKKMKVQNTYFSTSKVPCFSLKQSPTELNS